MNRFENFERRAPTAPHGGNRKIRLPAIVRTDFEFDLKLNLTQSRQETRENQTVIHWRFPFQILLTVWLFIIYLTGRSIVVKKIHSHWLLPIMFSWTPALHWVHLWWCYTRRPVSWTGSCCWFPTHISFPRSAGNCFAPEVESILWIRKTPKLTPMAFFSVEIWRKII